MRALAEFLNDCHVHVTGSDQSITPGDRRHFESLGIHLATADELGLAANAPNQVIPPELIVHSAAVPAHDPARRLALSEGIGDLSYPAFVAWLLANRHGLCIAGTHGKSTTTALTGWLLKALGQRPGVLVGAEFRGLGRSGWDEGGVPLVVESCEYQRHFLDYSPASAAILSIEQDHFDCYASLTELQATFQQFAARIKPSGTLVISAESLPEISWHSFTGAQVLRIGRETGHPDRTWTYDHVRLDRGGLQFQILYRGEPWATAQLPPGPEHNALHALAAIALCSTLVDIHAPDCISLVVEGLRSFPGLLRRFEVSDLGNNLSLIDDYAHHPTALNATIETARKIFRGRRLVGVFQPHQASRTSALLADFGQSLSKLDQCFLTPVYTARETVGPQEAVRLSEQLCEAIRSLGTPCEMLFALDPIPRTLDDSLRSGDLLLTLGAGNISRLHHAFIQRFCRDHPAG